MRIRPIPLPAPTSAVLTRAEMLSLPAAEVYVRLQGLCIKSSGSVGWRESVFSAGLLRALEDRGERLIDVGLARFSDDSEQLKRLWDRGVQELHHAILVNETIGPGLVFRESTDISAEGIRVHGADAATKRLQELLMSPDHELLGLFVTNPRTGTGWLNELFSRHAPFDVMAETQWIKLCGEALANPLLHEEPEESEYPTYPEGIEVRNLFAAISHLLLTVEVSVVAASALSRHLYRLADLSLPATDESSRADLKIGSGEWHKERAARAVEQLQTLLRRWRAPIELLDKEGNEPFPFAFLRQSIVQVLPSYPRELLETVKNSDDRACRLGYYIARDYRTPQEVTADYEKDGEEFLDAALENECLYRADHRNVAEHYEFLLHASDSSSPTRDWEYRQIMRHRRMKASEALFERDPSVYLQPREIRADERLDDEGDDWKPSQLRDLRAQYFSSLDVLTNSNWTTQIRRASKAAEELSELRFEATVARINSVDERLSSLREMRAISPSAHQWSFISGMVAGVVLVLVLHVLSK